MRNISSINKNEFNEMEKRKKPQVFMIFGVRQIVDDNPLGFSLKEN